MPISLTGQTPAATYNTLLVTDGASVFNGVGTQLSSLNLTSSHATLARTSSYAVDEFDVFSPSTAYARLKLKGLSGGGVESSLASTPSGLEIAGGVTIVGNLQADVYHGVDWPDSDPNYIGFVGTSSWARSAKSASYLNIASVVSASEFRAGNAYILASVGQMAATSFYVSDIGGISADGTLRGYKLNINDASFNIDQFGNITGAGSIDATGNTITAETFQGTASLASTANSSSYPWFLTGSNIAYFGNRVGINTYPRAGLHVASESVLIGNASAYGSTDVGVEVSRNILSQGGAVGYVLMGTLSTLNNQPSNGFYINPTIYGGGGVTAINSAMVVNATLGDINSATNLYANAMTKAGTGSVAAAYSLWATSPTIGATYNYNIYAYGAAPCYFGGKVGIGTGELGGTPVTNSLEVGGNISCSAITASLNATNGTIVIPTINGAATGTPVKGTMVYDTGSNLMYVFNGTAWKSASFA